MEDTQDIKEIEHVQIFYKNLKKLLVDGKNGFVIFEEQTTKKFVQFEQSKNIISLFYPNESDYITEFEKLLISKNINFDKSTDGIYSDFKDIKLASELTDSIFTKVFGLTNNYSINVELELNG